MKNQREDMTTRRTYSEVALEQHQGFLREEATRYRRSARTLEDLDRLRCTIQSALRAGVSADQVKAVSRLPERMWAWF